MICKHCRNDGNRIGSYGNIDLTRGLTYYLVCKNCERVIYEGAPSCIPESQKRRFIERIQKGKDDKGK
jgi:hypothetical protein